MVIISWLAEVEAGLFERRDVRCDDHVSHGFLGAFIGELFHGLGEVGSVSAGCELGDEVLVVSRTGELTIPVPGVGGGLFSGRPSTESHSHGLVLTIVLLTVRAEDVDCCAAQAEKRVH